MPVGGKVEVLVTALHEKSVSRCSTVAEILNGTRHNAGVLSKVIDEVEKQKSLKERLDKISSNVAPLPPTKPRKLPIA